MDTHPSRFATIVLLVGSAISITGCTETAQERRPPDPAPALVHGQDPVGQPAVSAPAASNASPQAVPYAAPVLPPLRLGPFVVGDAAYTVSLDRILASAGDTSVRRVTVVDSVGRVAYDEETTSVDQDPDSWLEFSPLLVEDGSARAVAFLFFYSSFPSAPGSGETFRFVVPRGDSLVSITPRINFYGDLGRLPSATRPNSVRLIDDRQLEVELIRYNFTATVPLRIDLSCSTGDCVRLALQDSIAGYARVAIRAKPSPLDSTVTVPLFETPAAADSLPLEVQRGTTIEVLGGAAHVSYDPRSGTVGADDDWLLIRVNRRTGWVHGDRTFTALGLPSFG